MLESKKLINDIDVSDISCNGNNTFVKVIKLENKYVYSPFLGCGNKVDNKVSEVSIIYPQSETSYSFNEDECNVLENNNIKIEASPSKSIKPSKSKKVKVKLKSITGINKNEELEYAWKKNKEIDNTEEWNKLEFNISDDK